MQLLPALHRLGPAAADLSESAYEVGARGHELLRYVVHRPTWDALRLTWAGHHRALAVHAVGDAISACLGCRSPVVFTPDGAVSPGQHVALMAVARMAPTLIVAPSPLPLGRVPAFLRRRLETHYIPPTFRLPRVRIARDAGLRQRLGFSPEDRVVLAIGDSDRAARHGVLLWAAAILAMVDRRWRLLILGSGSDLPRLIRFARAAPRPRLMTLARRYGPELTFADLISAADLAVDVADPRQGTSHGLLQCIAAELPVLTVSGSEAFPAALRLPADIVPKSLARRLLDLTDGTGLQQQVEVVSGVAERLRAARPEPMWQRLLERLTP